MEASGIQHVRDADGPQRWSVPLRETSFHTDAEGR